MRSACTGVVVLNYGPSDDSVACLDSLETSLDLDLDIVVVDNGPEDAAHAKLRAGVGERAEVMATGLNLGYAGGNNIGIARVLERGCDLVWILNPDTVVLPETLPALTAHLRAVPDCGLVGPRLLYPGNPSRIFFDGGAVDEVCASTSHLSFGLLEGRSPESTAHDVDYVTGASLLARRSMIEQVSPIPEHYFLYYEEADWCRRVRSAGWRTMVARQARMVHHKRSSDSLPKPYYLYYMTRNRYLFAERCLGVAGESALRRLDLEFLDPWRLKVERVAPHWLPAFDDIVRRAKADALAGLDGRNDLITTYPAATEDINEPEA